MFSKKFLVFLVLLVFCTSFTHARDFNQRTFLDITSVVSVPISFLESGDKPELDILIVNYTWMPREDYRQSIRNLFMYPDAENHQNYALFKIYEPNDFVLLVNFTTRSSSDSFQIKDKIDFPISGLSDDLIKYTEASQLIDITPDIRKVANEIAAGEDDLYVVVFKLADWVNTNIDYNLSTATSEANLPSSWVLKEKQGVCDELSNLFISMTRSLGIPARFVSGIAYTESDLFSENWGAHGWAEVYFPGYGWVPFDVTYNQLGFVDATHIKIDDGSEGEKYSIKYTWKATDIKVSPGEFNIESDVVNQGSLREHDLLVNVSFFKSEVDLGSYNVVVADIENLRGYYVARPFYISRTTNLEIVDEPIKDILLKPFEKKRIFWILGVNESMSSNFIYTFPVSVYSAFGEDDQEEFSASKNGEFISLYSAREYVGASKLSVDEVSFDFSCAFVDPVVYVNDDVFVNCNLFSNEDVSGTVCLADQCSDIDSSISSRSFSLKADTSEPGFRTMSVDVLSDKGDYSYFLTLKVLDETSIVFDGFEFSDKVKFDEQGFVRFVLNRSSDSVPKNVSISINGGLFWQTWSVDSIYDVQDFSLNFDGLDLKSGNNDFVVVVNYSDEKGKSFSLSKEFSVEMYGLNVWQKFLHWLRLM